MTGRRKLTQVEKAEHLELYHKAQAMGLQPHNRMGIPRLKAMIAEAENGMQTTQQEIPTSAEPSQEKPQESVLNKLNVPEGNVYQPMPGEKYFLTEEEYLEEQFNSNKKDAGRLVRCRITCMNPHKKNWTGEIFSVGSSKLGTFKKFIPYNTEEPYHIPWIIYQALKERQCRIGVTVKNSNGQETNSYKLINEFSIEVLDPLTETELKDLKQRQAMASGTVVTH